MAKSMKCAKFADFNQCPSINHFWYLDLPYSLPRKGRGGWKSQVAGRRDFCQLEKVTKEHGHMVITKIHLAYVNKA